MTTKSETKSSASKPVEEFHKLVAQKGFGRAVAEKMLELPPEVDPPVLGSRMRIWKQDPSVKGLELPRTVYIHTQVNDGPSDSQIAIQGIASVAADLNRDFLLDPAANMEAFDAVHTYTIVRQVLTMFQRVLNKKLDWQWNTNGNEQVINVYPHAGETENAYYDRDEKALKFFYFTPPRNSGLTLKVFTCRSLDVVAHETGHAVLDSLKPEWILWNAPAQTGALHESFGDLTSIFLILSQMDLVEYIVAETKADLHQKNVVAALAEEFGLAFKMTNGLRNADNDLKLSEVTPEVHDLSQVFTGGVFDILADLFTSRRDPRVRDSAEVLYQTGKYMAGLVLRAIIQAPNTNATFADVANAMIAIAKADGEEDCAKFVQKHFEFREVLGAKAFAAPIDLSHFGMYPSRRCSCGTMQHPQYRPTIPNLNGKKGN
ncbi:hypothetical protein ACE1AT_26280 [Pelatocladus sp. BLCC-F211]|uniref:hypothetical protein n=1 Tax=Pelatocladus sp. BLCC-F211 TaxID=3342752 RepID=UPI0035B98FFB